MLMLSARAGTRGSKLVLKLLLTATAALSAQVAFAQNASSIPNQVPTSAQIPSTAALRKQEYRRVDPADFRRCH